MSALEMPAEPAMVAYASGELSIRARNSSLREVLRSVCQQAGAVLELPRDADERIVADVGPGPVRDVLGSLLNGSQFNYLLLGSTDDPHALARLVLTLKPPPPPETAARAGNQLSSQPGVIQQPKADRQQDQAQLATLQAETAAPMPVVVSQTEANNRGMTEPRDQNGPPKPPRRSRKHRRIQPVP